MQKDPILQTIYWIGLEILLSHFLDLDQEMSIEIYLLPILLLAMIMMTYSTKSIEIIEPFYQNFIKDSR